MLRGGGRGTKRVILGINEILIFNREPTDGNPNEKGGKSWASGRLTTSPREAASM